MATSAKTTVPNKQRDESKAILDRAKAINAKAKEYGKELHAVLCDALEHVQKYQNPTLLTSVFHTVHHVTFVRGIQMWVQRFSNLTYRKSGDKPAMFRKKEGEKLTIKSAEAKKTPFWDLPEVQALQRPMPAIDIDGRIASVIRLCDKHAMAGKIKGDKDKALKHLAQIKDFAEKTLGMDPDLLSYQGDATPPASTEESNPTDESEAEQQPIAA